MGGPSNCICLIPPAPDTHPFWGYHVNPPLKSELFPMEDQGCPPTNSRKKTAGTWSRGIVSQSGCLAPKKYLMNSRVGGGGAEGSFPMSLTQVPSQNRPPSSLDCLPQWLKTAREARGATSTRPSRCGPRTSWPGSTGATCGSSRGTSKARCF